MASGEQWCAGLYAPVAVLGNVKYSPLSSVPLLLAGTFVSLKPLLIHLETLRIITCLEHGGCQFMYDSFFFIEGLLEGFDHLFFT